MIFSFVTKLFGQDFAAKTVIIKRAKNSAFVSSFDTVYFKSDKKEILKSFTKVITGDSVITFKNIQVGKYFVEFSCKEMIVSPIDIAVCSKCDNEFEYYASVKSTDGKGLVWTWVNEMPMYEGGNLTLAKDFQNSLNKSDKRILRHTPNFTISFFVTKNSEISDIAFTPDDLSKEIKAIIRKAILKTKHWKNAKQNGVPSDEIFTIDKETLIKS